MQSSKTSKQKQFFFVNKSENSTHLSRSLSSEKAAVQRYVQTGRKRSRKAKNVKFTAKQQITHESLEDSSGEALKGDRTQSIYTTPERTNSGQNVDKSGIDSRICIVRRGHHMSLSSQKLLCRQDPFNAASVTIDKRVGGLLHYYLNFYHPSQWPNEMMLLQHGVYIYHDRVLTILRTAIADKLTMYCLLSAASCRLQFIDRLPFPRIVGTEQFYISHALELLNFYLNIVDLDDPKQLKQCLTCIGFLNSAEAYRGDMVAAQTHFNASVKILDRIGGLAGLDEENMRGHLAMGDLFLACVNLRPCLLDCSYDPGPVKSLQLLDSELVSPQRFATASNLLERDDSLIPAELKTVILELMESHAVKMQISTTTMTSKRAMQVTHWITLRNMAIRHRLLALVTIDQRIHALRIAIIMWTLLTMNVTGRAKTVKLMACNLDLVLSGSTQSDWMNNEDIKLWVVLVGLGCVDEGSQVSFSLLKELRSLKHVFGLQVLPETSISDLSESLKAFQYKFLFDELVQQPRNYEIARKLKQVLT